MPAWLVRDYGVSVKTKFIHGTIFRGGVTGNKGFDFSDFLG